MEYNTKKKDVVIKEYGRNVQNLIEYAITVEDPKRKEAIVHLIVDFMRSVIVERDKRDYNIFSDQDEAVITAWQHLAYITKGSLNIQMPEGVIPVDPNQDTIQQTVLTYPERKKHYMSYGRYAGEFLLRANEFSDESKRQYLTESIGHYMQHSYNQWQSDSVSNEQILHDIQAITGGDYAVSDTADFSDQNGGNKHRRNKNSRNNNFKQNKNKKNNYRRYKK